MAELACPPGLPSVLEGMLDLAGTAIPVVRLDRLFRLPAQRVGLYSMLVILRIGNEQKIGVLADRIAGVVTVREDELRPIGEEDCFNGCSGGTVMAGDRILHILSPGRLILTRERETLLEFRMMAQQRLGEWRTAQA